MNAAASDFIGPVFKCYNKMWRDWHSYIMQICGRDVSVSVYMRRIQISMCMLSYISARSAWRNLFENIGAYHIDRVMHSNWLWCIYILVKMKLYMPLKHSESRVNWACNWNGHISNTKRLWKPSALNAFRIFNLFAFSSNFIFFLFHFNFVIWNVQLLWNQIELFLYGWYSLLCACLCLMCVCVRICGFFFEFYRLYRGTSSTVQCTNIIMEFINIERKIITKLYKCLFVHSQRPRKAMRIQCTRKRKSTIYNKYQLKE